MSPRSRGARSVLETLTNPSVSRNAHLCRTCRNTITARGYASTATAQTVAEPPSVISQASGTGPGTSPLVQPQTNIKAGIVLSRPPLITPDPHPFETAYYLYQRRLNERLVLPFTQFFYFRKDTPAYDNWRKRRLARGGVAARDIGKYNAYAAEKWNDEVLIGDDSAEPSKIVRQLIEEEGRQDEFSGEDGDKSLAGLRRTTDADVQNDQRSLERSLSRTLYLLVKSKKQSKNQPDSTLWCLPSGSLEGREGLKEAAQRILDQSCGINMNTWFVGNHPIGHQVRDLKLLQGEKKAQDSQQSTDEEKTFFMKARIMAGQADLKGNNNDIEDFKWLAKEEVQKVVSPHYWSSIKNMLVAQ